MLSPSGFIFSPCCFNVVALLLHIVLNKQLPILILRTLIITLQPYLVTMKLAFTPYFFFFSSDSFIFSPYRLTLSASSFILLLLYLVALQLHFFIRKLNLIAASSSCNAPSFRHLEASCCHLEAWFCHLAASSYSCFVFLPCSFNLSFISLISFLHHLFALLLHFVI